MHPCHVTPTECVTEAELSASGTISFSLHLGFLQINVAYRHDTIYRAMCINFFQNYASPTSSPALILHDLQYASQAEDK